MKTIDKVLTKINLLTMITIICCISVSSLSCSKPSNTTETEKKIKKPRIALIMKSLANEFFKTMEEGARKHHQEN
ncbi:MAG TPA: hypothetical protein PLX23_05375, partial [Candidatus Hydrogenedens sp.]|nr:hypothetical protein [Candidatus Hydrogenedens sp.]